MIDIKLPPTAIGSLNRCNLPPRALASVTFQRHPCDIFIDGVLELHQKLFEALDAVPASSDRAVHFRDYMSACFLLDHREQAGFCQGSQKRGPAKTDYIRLLRGWMFNADSVEGAVLKRWTESRFGLMTLRHGGEPCFPGSRAAQRYHLDYVRGLYNSNALEAQLDLLYTYCQYELRRRDPDRSWYQLYRGVCDLGEHATLQCSTTDTFIVLLNNLNSFTDDRSHACTFGDTVLSSQVPFAKILYFHDLVPGILAGENEYLVIGGAYQVRA